MFMTKYKIKLPLILALFFLGFCLGSFCYAQETEQPVSPPGETSQAVEEAAPDRPTVNINTTFFSHYIWRGFELSHDSLVIFPTITISYKGFSINWWGDIDIDYEGEPDGLQCWEQDYLIWYSNAWKKLNYTLGYIHYNTNNPAHWDTQEIWLALGLSMFLNPTFSVWYDIEDSGSQYYNLALSHSFPISKDRFGLCRDWSFDVGGWVSYYRQNDWTKDKVNYSAWHDGNVWAGLKIPLSDVCSITPKVQYSWPLSYKARTALKAASFEGDDADFVYGGLILDYNF